MKNPGTNVMPSDAEQKVRREGRVPGVSACMDCGMQTATACVTGRVQEARGMLFPSLGILGARNMDLPNHQCVPGTP